jgi:hypothetical protein
MEELWVWREILWLADHDKVTIALAIPMPALEFSR